MLFFRLQSATENLTVNSICLLVTIAAAAASDDIKIRNQIPRKFHRSQTLVLCPSGVIENWIDEFAIWAPSGHKLGEIRDITPRAQQDEIFERLERIKHWNSNGGVLIMSYEMLRSLINYKPTKASRALSIEQQELLSDCLLSGPNIIVADEAHKLKGEKSAISQIASRFKTTNRIAMTGSPLANHLSEYYQMVEWISPGYLESPQSFKTKFMEPIQAGSYIDSTKAEQRESLCALQVLGGILNPKIHRADTSAIASDLPSKTEFVILVPLTELQQRAYDTFVTCLKTSHESDSATKLWSWLALLQLCCNHPVPFREKLAGRSNQPGGDLEEALDGDSSASVLPRSIKDAGLPSDLFPKIEALFKNIPEPLGPEFSHRSTLLNQILNEAADVGDKVLVFSQSIPTMDYLDKLLTRSGRKFLRLDGKTPSSQRQSLCKQFNTSDTEQVFLISTRAGGLGLNITGANRVVIFDFLFNPTWEDQAIGRAYRLGQKKPVFVYRFIAGGTFEDNIFNMAVYKRQLAVRVVDKINTIREAEKKTVEYLNTVRQVERENHDAILGKDPQVLDKILAGSFGRIALRVTLSHIKDNESDTLDGTEQKRVADELYMEQLKRSSRPAYEAEIQRRQAMLAAEMRKQDEELKRPFYQMTQNWQHRESAIPMSFESDVAVMGALQVVPYMPTAMGLLQQGNHVAPTSPLGYLPSSASMYQHHATRPQIPAVTHANRQIQVSSPGSVFCNPSLQSERRLEATTAKSVTPLTCPISRVPLHAADIATPEPSPSSLSEPMEISSDNDPYSPQLNSDPYSPSMEFGDHDAYSPPPA
jgi:superfamily II DNA or RNA helicase